MTIISKKHILKNIIAMIMLVNRICSSLIIGKKNLKKPIKKKTKDKKYIEFS